MIEVKVLSSENVTKKIKHKKAKILTPEYVRQLNQGIAYRIRQNQIGQAEQEELQKLVRKRVLK